MDNLNLIIPMAGNGSRFREAGYKTIKPLIPLKSGKPMIEEVVNSLQFPDANYIFIVQDQHDKEFGLEGILSNLVKKCTIVRTNGLTGGAAETILLAEKFCDPYKPVMVVNSDQLIEYNKEKFIDEVFRYWDGIIFTFNSNDPKWSYVKLQYEKAVCEVVEKQVVSDHSTCGIYFYKTTYLMFNSIRNMMNNYQNKVNNEWYFAPSYNEAIKRGYCISAFYVDKMIGLGDPESLERYLNDYSS